MEVKQRIKSVYYNKIVQLKENIRNYEIKTNEHTRNLAQATLIYKSAIKERRRAYSKARLLPAIRSKSYLTPITKNYSSNFTATPLTEAKPKRERIAVTDDCDTLKINKISTRLLSIVQKLNKKIKIKLALAPKQTLGEISYK